MFNKKQAQSGLSKTDFIAELIKNSKVTVLRFGDSIKPIYSELRKIGVNLNQIAYLVNIGRHTQAEKDIMQMKIHYNKTLDRLNDFLDNPELISEDK